MITSILIFQSRLILFKLYTILSYYYSVLFRYKNILILLKGAVMPDYDEQYQDIIKELTILSKKIKAVLFHFDKKEENIKSQVKNYLNKLIGIHSMLNKIISRDIDFSEMKENEIESKLLEVKTTVKDVSDFLEKTVSEIEKQYGKRLKIMDKRDV